MTWCCYKTSLRRVCAALVGVFYFGCGVVLFGLSTFGGLECLLRWVDSLSLVGLLGIVGSSVFVECSIRLYFLYCHRSLVNCACC